MATHKLKYAVVGAGMAGILAAIKLKEAGEDFTVFEKARQIGGTWRDNRYPGLTCDVPAHAYTYSFEPNPDWLAFYATGTEIQEYFEKVVAKYGILPFIRFGAEVTSLEWNDAAAKWAIETRDGEQGEFDAVIVASGVLHHQRLPDIEGLDCFDGPAFHSARWDGRAPIKDARVGLIGSGSTGIQIVTALNKKVERLIHFQRSPQWVMPVPYCTYSEEEREAFRKDPALIDAIRYSDEYIGNVIRFTDAITDADGPRMKEVEDLCREYFEASIVDPELKEKLRPRDRAACKRLIYSWCYYQEVQHPSVFVETNGIRRIEPNGVRMDDDTLHEIDTLILATGFHADRFIRPARVVGRGGQTLDAFWERRPTAYYAVTVPNFPNFFMLNGPSSPVGNFSLIDIAERQWGYIEQLIAPLRRGEAKWVAPTAAAHAEYEERRIAAAKKTIFGSGCSSWYLDDEGIPATWPWSYNAFAEAMNTPVMSQFALGSLVVG